MVQMQTAIACEIIKKKLSMENAMTNTSDQIMFVKELGKIVKDQGLFRSPGTASSDVGACRPRRRRVCFSYEAGTSASSRGIGCNLY